MGKAIKRNRKNCVYFRGKIKRFNYNKLRLTTRMYLRGWYYKCFKIKGECKGVNCECFKSK
jgi:hypothetical protein